MESGNVGLKKMFRFSWMWLVRASGCLVERADLARLQAGGSISVHRKFRTCRLVFSYLHFFRTIINRCRSANFTRCWSNYVLEQTWASPSPLLFSCFGDLVPMRRGWFPTFERLTEPGNLGGNWSFPLHLPLCPTTNSGISYAVFAASATDCRRWICLHRSGGTRVCFFQECWTAAGYGFRPIVFPSSPNDMLYH